jgi:hypothetical protein
MTAMLRSLKDLENYAIGATDGPIGHVRDFFFDDDAWVVRYLVVDTGTWLNERRVLISPVSLRRPDWASRLLPVNISREQVKSSPDIDTHMPVSRQHEVEFLGHYRYPDYWGGVGLWGEGLYPYAMLADDPVLSLDDDPERLRAVESSARAERARRRNDDPHLRSARAVVGYHLQASDGEIGHVDSLLVDEETWAIRYLVVNTSHWWMGHQVLISPGWVTEVSWANERITVDLSRAAIQAAPAYDSTLALNRQREQALHAHHQRPGYWGTGDLLGPDA